MKTIFLLGIATALSVATCEHEEYRKGSQPEIKTVKSVNDPSILKQKIKKELGILKISEIISDLNELQARTNDIAKNMP